MSTESYMPLLIALVGSAGLWGFLSQRNKMLHERAMKEDELSSKFNETLASQVNKLADKLDRLSEDKEQLLIDMAGLKAQLAEANATIKHLEEMLRQRQD